MMNLNKIVKPKDLRLENLKNQLKRNLDKEFMLGDYYTTGGVFKEAAEELGFHCEQDRGSIIIHMNPKEYYGVWINDSMYAKKYIGFITKIRGSFRYYINEELIDEGYGNIASGVYNLRIDLDDIITALYYGVILDQRSETYANPRKQFSFKRKYIDKPFDTSLIKKEFNWLIDELIEAGYDAAWHTTPSSISIDITIPKE
jgi:hypothetical protein